MNFVSNVFKKYIQGDSKQVDTSHVKVEEKTNSTERGQTKLNEVPYEISQNSNNGRTVFLQETTPILNFLPSNEAGASTSVQFAKHKKRNSKNINECRQSSSPESSRMSEAVLLSNSDRSVTMQHSEACALPVDVDEAVEGKLPTKSSSQENNNATQSKLDNKICFGHTSIGEKNISNASQNVVPYNFEIPVNLNMILQNKKDSELEQANKCKLETWNRQADIKSALDQNDVLNDVQKEVQSVLNIPNIKNAKENSIIKKQFAHTENTIFISGNKESLSDNQQEGEFQKEGLLTEHNINNNNIITDSIQICNEAVQGDTINMIQSIQFSKDFIDNSTKTNTMVCNYKENTDKYQDKLDNMVESYGHVVENKSDDIKGTNVLAVGPLEHNSKDKLIEAKQTDDHNQLDEEPNDRIVYDNSDSKILASNINNKTDGQVFNNIQTIINPVEVTVPNEEFLKNAEDVTKKEEYQESLSKKIEHSKSDNNISTKENNSASSTSSVNIVKGHMNQNSLNKENKNITDLKEASRETFKYINNKESINNQNKPKESLNVDNTQEENRTCTDITISEKNERAIARIYDIIPVECNQIIENEEGNGREKPISEGSVILTEKEAKVSREINQKPHNRNSKQKGTKSFTEKQLCNKSIDNKEVINQNKVTNEVNSNGNDGKTLSKDVPNIVKTENNNIMKQNETNFDINQVMKDASQSKNDCNFISTEGAANDCIKSTETHIEQPANVSTEISMNAQNHNGKQEEDITKNVIKEVQCNKVDKSANNHTHNSDEILQQETNVIEIETNSLKSFETITSQSLEYTQLMKNEESNNDNKATNAEQITTIGENVCKSFEKIANNSVYDKGIVGNEGSSDKENVNEMLTKESLNMIKNKNCNEMSIEAENLHEKDYFTEDSCNFTPTESNQSIKNEESSKEEKTTEEVNSDDKQIYVNKAVIEEEQVCQKNNNVGTFVNNGTNNHKECFPPNCDQNMLSENEKVNPCIAIMEIQDIKSKNHQAINVEFNDNIPSSSSKELTQRNYSKEHHFSQQLAAKDGTIRNTCTDQNIKEMKQFTNKQDEFSTEKNKDLENRTHANLINIQQSSNQFESTDNIISVENPVTQEKIINECFDIVKGSSEIHEITLKDCIVENKLKQQNKEGSNTEEKLTDEDILQAHTNLNIPYQPIVDKTGVCTKDTVINSHVTENLIQNMNALIADNNSLDTVNQISTNTGNIDDILNNFATENTKINKSQCLQAEKPVWFENKTLIIKRNTSSPVINVNKGCVNNHLTLINPDSVSGNPNNQNESLYTFIDNVQADKRACRTGMSSVDNASLMKINDNPLNCHEEIKETTASIENINGVEFVQIQGIDNIVERPCNDQLIQNEDVSNKLNNFHLLAEIKPNIDTSLNMLSSEDISIVNGVETEIDRKRYKNNASPDEPLALSEAIENDSNGSGLRSDGIQEELADVTIRYPANRVNFNESSIIIRDFDEMDSVLDGNRGDNDCDVTYQENALVYSLQRTSERNERENEVKYESACDSTSVQMVEKYRELAKLYEGIITKQAKDLEILREKCETSNRLFSSTEMAFSDLYLKYQKSRETIELYKENEDKLLFNIESTEDQIDKVNAKYEAMYSCVEDQIHEAEKEVAKEKQNLDFDIAKLESTLKRIKIKVLSLENSLKQKTQECQALSAFWEDMTGFRKYN